MSIEDKTNRLGNAVGFRGLKHCDIFPAPIYVRTGRLSKIALFVSSALILISQSTAYGQTWTGAVNTDWATSGNWNNSAVPATGDTVTINNGALASQPRVITNQTVQQTNVSAGSLTVDATLTSPLAVFGGQVVVNQSGSIIGSVFVSAGAVITFNQTGARTIGNTFSGAGAITLSGAGLVSLSGSNSGFSGDLNLLNNASLVVSSGSSYGTGSIILNGTAAPGVGATLQTGTGAQTLSNAVQVSGGSGSRSAISTVSGDLTLTGVVSLNGTLVKQGSGTLTLTNNGNSATVGVGVIQIDQGRLRLEANNAAGGANGSIITQGSVISYANGVTNATPITVNSNTTQFEVLTGASAQQLGEIGETGGARPIEKIGSGTLILGGFNSFNGPVTVTAGVLNIQNAGGLGTSASGTTVQAGAALELQGGIFIGAEALTLFGTGVANGGALRNVSGSNTFGGAITLGSPSRINSDAGQLTFGAVNNGGNLLTVGGSGNLLTGADISGSGGLTKDGSGSLSLTGTTTYTGLTTVSAGILRLVSGTAIVDSGAVIINSPGTLQLLASESIGSLGGDGRVTFENAASTLTVGGTNASTTFSGAIENGGGGGVGSFEKIGSGTLTLSGANSYSGATTISAGTLAVNGSIAGSSSVAVNSGGTLGGTGTLPSTVVNAGGTLSPGNSVGTLQVNGNLTLNAGSTTRIEVFGSTIDRVNVTGTASLDGTLTFLPTGGTYAFNSPYAFIRAGTLSGAFATTTAGSFGDGVKTFVSYTGTEARLTLTPAALVPIVTPPVPPSFGGGNNRNRLAVAGALDGAVTRGQDVSAYFNLYNQSAFGILRGLDVTSGQVGSMAATLTYDTTNQFLLALLDPNSRGLNRSSGEGPPLAREIADLPGPPPLLAPMESRTSVWARAFGAFGSVRADAGIGSFAQTTSSAGIAVGGDYRVNRDLVLGVAMGGSSGWAANAAALGRASADTFQLGLYGAARFGQLQLAAAASYALADVTTNRQNFLGTSADLTGRLKAHAVSGRIEAAWRMENAGLRGLTLTPFAAFQSQWVFTPRYSEGTTQAALQPFALTYSAKTNATVRTELGLRTDLALTEDVAFFGRLGWAAYLVRDSAVTAGFASLPGTTFTVTGGRVGTHSALGSVGLDWRMNAMTTFSARVDAELSDRHAVANGSVRVLVRF